MKLSGFLKPTLAGLACFGVLFPQIEVSAAPPAQLVTGQVQEDAKVILATDVSLDEEGVLHGTIVDKNGLAAVEADVLIKQGRREVAHAKTNAKGEFSVSKLRGGNYEIAAGETVSFVRVWTNGTAPPKALKNALIVSSGKFVRGQGVIPPADLVAGLLLGGVVAAVTISAINMSNINRIKKTVNENNAGINAIQNSLN